MPYDPDDEEITRPGTPDSLRTMHDMRDTQRRILQRLDAICGALDRLERALPAVVRDSRTAKAEANLALDRAREASTVARFADKRVDALVARVQAAENASR